MIELPKTKTKALTKSPNRLLIYSAPKVGKTSLIAGLDNCLILDLQRGSETFEAMRYKIESYHDIYEVCEEIKKQGKPYRYGAIDTTTDLETLCMPLALKLYQQTPMGRTYTGNILALPNGAGYLYLRNAYELLIDVVGSAFDRIILSGHLKDKFIEKAGKEVSAKDIDLTGRLKAITCSNVDAIGYLYRDGNKNVLSFTTSEEIICGARSNHLRNKNIVVSEYNPDTDELTTFWDKIYID